MSVTHTVTKAIAGGSGLPVSSAVQLTASEELNFNFLLAADTTNQQFNLAFTKADLQSIWISTDTENVVVKTNSSSAPQDTLTITAGDPYQWDITSGIPNPFAGSVTTAYATNAQSSSCNVIVKCLTNG